jgi:hypothetical protein
MARCNCRNFVALGEFDYNVCGLSADCFSRSRIALQSLEMEIGLKWFRYCCVPVCLHGNVSRIQIKQLQYFISECLSFAGLVPFILGTPYYVTSSTLLLASQVTRRSCIMYRLGF